MRKTIFLLSLCTFLAYPALADMCQQKNPTQADMNACSRQELAASEKKLNDFVEKLKADYADQPEKQKRLIQAQEAWKKYADAQISLLYADVLGSVIPLCDMDTLNYLTRERLKQLEQWSESEKGNICGNL